MSYEALVLTMTNEELLENFATASYWSSEGWDIHWEMVNVELPLLRAEILRRMG